MVSGHVVGWNQWADAYPSLQRPVRHAHANAHRYCNSYGYALTYGFTYTDRYSYADRQPSAQTYAVPQAPTNSAASPVTQPQRRSASLVDPGRPTPTQPKPLTESSCEHRFAAALQTDRKANPSSLFSLRSVEHFCDISWNERTGSRGSTRAAELSWRVARRVAGISARRRSSHRAGIGAGDFAFCAGVFDGHGSKSHCRVAAETSRPAINQRDFADSRARRHHHHHKPLRHSAAGATNPGTGAQRAQRLARHSRSHRIGYTQLSGHSRRPAAHRRDRRQGRRRGRN